MAVVEQGLRLLDLPRQRLPRGRVFVIPERCKECSFCIDFCPRQVLVKSPHMNSKGYHYPVVAPGKENDCVHCQFCSLVCPEMAIYTVEVEA